MSSENNNANGFLKISREAILEVAKSFFADATLREISLHAVVKISEILKVPRCVIYRVFEKTGPYWQGEKDWCEIIAGVPEGEHEVGLSEPLIQHPDIGHAARQKTVIIIENPSIDDRTAHFQMMVAAKGIKQIAYVPLISKKGAMIGTIVLDAVGDKIFVDDEIDFCRQAGELIALFLGRDGAVFQDMRHQIINPLVAISGWVDQLTGNIIALFDITQKCLSNGNGCQLAKEINEAAYKILLAKDRIRLDAKRLNSMLPIAISSTD